jgi:hypothetical protein
MSLPHHASFEGSSLVFEAQWLTNSSVVTSQVALVSKCGVDRGGWTRLYFLQEASARVFVYPINVVENVFGQHRRLV